MPFDAVGDPNRLKYKPQTYADSNFQCVFVCLFVCVWPFIRKIIDRFSYLSHRMTVYRKPAALSTVTIGTNLSLSVALSLSVSRDSFISYLLWAIKLFEVIKFILYMITVFQLPLMTIITPNFKPIRFSHFWYQQYCTICLPGRYVLCAICTLQCALVFRGRVNRLCDFMCWFSLSKTASHTFFSISIRWSYALHADWIHSLLALCLCLVVDLCGQLRTQNHFEHTHWKQWNLWNICVN